MLAISDRWWMNSWDDWKYKRYGHQRREKETCFPLQLRKNWDKFSVERKFDCPVLETTD
jgi:hypothetical protein